MSQDVLARIVAISLQEIVLPSTALLSLKGGKFDPYFRQDYEKRYTKGSTPSHFGRIDILYAVKTAFNNIRILHLYLY